MRNNELEQLRKDLDYWEDKMRHGKTKKERENATKVYNELARAYFINLMAQIKRFNNKKKCPKVNSPKKNPKKSLSR